MCSFHKRYCFPIWRIFSHGMRIITALWGTVPLLLPKVTCGSSQQSPCISETPRSKYFPMYSPLPSIFLHSSRPFICCLVLITQLCSQVWILHLSPQLPPSLQGPEAGGCGAATLSHPILVGTDAERVSRFDGVGGATSETWQTGTASYADPRAPTAAGRQNASQVCAAAPALNNVRLCRRSPRSHPRTAPLQED